MELFIWVIYKLSCATFWCKGYIFVSIYMHFLQCEGNLGKSSEADQVHAKVDQLTAENNLLQ